MTDKEVFAKAKVLIQEKKYDEARQLLTTIAKNPMAQEWLVKLEGLAKRTTGTNATVGAKRQTGTAATTPPSPNRATSALAPVPPSSPAKTDTQILTLARELIKDQKFDEARKTLAPIADNNETAQKWLLKIEELDDPFAAPLPKPVPRGDAGEIVPATPRPVQTQVHHLACPHCQLHDQIQKVQAIVGSETSQTSGTASTTTVGAFGGRGGGVGFGGLNVSQGSTSINTQTMSLLAQNLDAPPEPQGAKGFAIFCIVIGAASFLCLTSSSILFGLGGLALVGLGIFLIVRDMQRVKRETLAWQGAVERWFKAYYCRRCDMAYIPGENQAVVPQGFLHLLYQA